MTEALIPTTQYFPQYRLKAHLGEGDVISATDRPAKTRFDWIRHNFSLPFADSISEEERVSLLNDPSVHVYRRGIFRKNRGILDTHIVTNTGGTFRRSTRGVLSIEGPRVLGAFLKGSKDTWVAVKLAGDITRPIEPPKTINLRKTS